MISFFGAFAAFLVLGVPIALALGLACAVLLWWSGNLDLLAALPQRDPASITAVDSVTGPILPPSIAMIVYGVLTGTSIAKLFLAGVIPGFMIGGCLMVYAYWQARRHGYPVSDPMSWRKRLATT